MPGGAEVTVKGICCTGMSVEEEQGSGVRKVHAFMQESTVLVWDAHGIKLLAGVIYEWHLWLNTCINLTDVMYLREKWRIIGGLIGALPSHPRQNAQLGLPLKLMPEETTLLLEMGIYIISSIVMQYYCLWGTVTLFWLCDRCLEAVRIYATHSNRKRCQGIQWDERERLWRAGINTI